MHLLVNMNHPEVLKGRKRGVRQLLLRRGVSNQANTKNSIRCKADVPCFAGIAYDEKM